MKFFEKLDAFAGKARQESISNKNSNTTGTRSVHAFLRSILEYGIDNPDEIICDYSCRIGENRVEQLAYAIVLDQSIHCLVKQVEHGTRMGAFQRNALSRAHNACAASLSILTDGRVYEFFADLLTPGIMDRTPFLVVDLRNIDAPSVSKLKLLTKSAYRSIPTTQSPEELNYIKSISHELKRRITKPDEDFMKNFCRAGL
ncbi:hypothetical protein [Pseudomonas nitroreducens]|uniref:Uncharacterized protein n=1 Tax=Pseudomonas nitroreducens TaxID=46680 RepID=A0A6G6IWQ1_PSENT|nr:hypothetical protein [Pseudomonas nitroreducens]MBG6289292.1 hypothetical protein [Pseudomonas nitroreducens]NMZ58860.1 hypothetical protein [Pseudomonas nitroreducens]QIE87424.1 hypothetical protein G5B91_14580 [Pseudomonas nitroreducens]SNS67248.1 hypothetical protein SAMN05216209_2105 [Pseudomonas nitroreducens]